MKHYLLLLPFAALGACGSGKTEKKETSADTAKNSPNATTPAPAAPADEERAAVAFNVNGASARTRRAGGNDNEAQLGMVNVQNMSLSFDLLGDVPERPHRGWLHFSIEKFSFEPATYTAAGGSSARFTRYETANAGGAVDYNASEYAKYKGSSFTLQFTGLKKNDAAQFGEEWLASGTFTAKLLLNEFATSDQKEVAITEGRFENVPISVLGRKN